MPDDEPREIVVRVALSCDAYVCALRLKKQFGVAGPAARESREAHSQQLL
jgi:hypothetical protein